MYKIYVNGTELILCQSKKAKKHFKSSDQVLVNKYPGKSRYLLNYIDMMEKSQRWDQVIVHSDDYKAMRKDWKKVFPTVKACGGMVVNPQQEILFIYRRGHWDLPKGKSEGKETKKETAIREVMEETGIDNITIIDKLITTRHLYRGRSGKRFVKKSHWYLMRAPNQDLTPQTEEDIIEARWMTLADWKKETLPTYDNIKLVLKDGKHHITKL